MQILNLIEEKRQFYDNQTIKVPGDEEYSQSELIHSINCARLSKYVEEDAAQDDIIGQFPYDNVSKYRIRLEARAIDPDTKQIEVEPLDGSREARISAMIATKALRKKMRQMKLANTFNRMTDVWSEYGGVLVKKTDEGVHVQPWETVITDMSDILGGLIITRHYYTPSQLKKQGWSNVDDVIRSAAQARKEADMDKTSDNENETITDLIEIWEVHGEVTQSEYKEAEAEFNETEYSEEEDDGVTFVKAQIIIAPEGKDDDGEMQGTIMQINKESDDVFKYMARNPVSGRGLGQGIVEELGEHQRWHNFFKTEEARAVAIGGKVLFVTNDGNVVDTIYDDGIDHGTILKVGNVTGNEFFQQLSTLPSSVPLYGDIQASWGESGDRVTNSFATALGDQEFANVPFKAQYLQDLNTNSQFKQYYEEMAEELIKPIIEDWVLPEALSEAADDDEIYETFTKSELALIDEVIISKELPERIAQTILSEGRAVSPEETEAMAIGLQTELDRTGPRRNIKQIKKFIEAASDKVIIHTSDEQRSKQTLFESYSNALALFQPTDPAFYALRDRILDQMGVSQEELSLYAEEAMQFASSMAPENPQLEQTGVAEEDLKAELIS